MKYKMQNVLVSVFLGLSVCSGGQAACTVSGNSATPLKIGPRNPNNGFAEYIRDTNGLALELCLSPSQPTIDPATGAVISPVGTAPFCFFDPPAPNNAFSTQIGFGAEGFWWLASPDTRKFPANMKAVMVLAAEAAFLNEVVDGGQFPFTRLRIRLDLPVTGFYRITEPYGQHIYPITALQAGDEVFDSFDIEFQPGAVDADGNVTEASNSTNCVGPWLTWDTFASNDPALDNTGDGVPDFIGDGDTPHLITGSPSGNNLFRIEAFSDAALTVPLNTFDPTDADGNGSSNSVETRLFSVAGKVFDGRLATPMVAERTTYTRDATGANGQVDVFAHGAATAQVSATGEPNVSGSFDLRAEQGGFFESKLLTPDATVIPPAVEIDATDGGASIATDPTHLIRPLVDHVSITRAEFDLGAVPPALTVEATSSDAFGSPVLTLVELNRSLQAGRVAVSEAAPNIPLAPPGVVTVSSSAGGSATKQVEVINSDEDGEGIPNTADNCPLIANSQQEDADDDGVGDVCDNCRLVPNGPRSPDKGGNTQRDTNGDGFGNVCDPDLNNDGVVNNVDVGLFKLSFLKAGDIDADFDGDHLVNNLDAGFIKSYFLKAPGPSRLAP